MSKYRNFFTKPLYALLSLIISIEVFFPVYYIKIFNGDYYLAPDKTYLMIAVFTVLLFALHIFARMKIKAFLAILLFVPLVWISIVIYYLSAYSFFAKHDYAVSDSKAELYSGKKVMLLVPHQDDEINLLGGVIEEYVNYGSEIWVVFSTNGDYYGQQELRFAEAKEVLGLFGVDSEHIIFLGYGDQWKGKHIYNSAPDELKTSFFGRTETYGNGSINVFRPGREYTYNNFHDDVKDVVLEYRPDIIFCVDYDSHQDHRALSLVFERVMGEILSEGTYRPTVMKGFAYSTAWFAPEDFCDDQFLLSTVNKFDTEYSQENNIYLWSERTRLPVCPDSLSYCMEFSRIYDALLCYKSQGAMLYADSVINSDKVFWERETGSLCYDADVLTSSGNASLLNNFMLTDSTDILSSALPFDGTWIPDADDEEKSVRISFKDERDIYRLCLYDNPSIEDNVLNARIRFDDGSVYETGPLLANGSATELCCEKENVREFVVTITDYEGSKAGLTEIEAYAQPRKEPFSFLKLVNEKGDFVYDYRLSEEDVEFSIYSMGLSGDLTEDSYSLSCDNKKCSARIEDRKIKLNCPVGQSCTLTLSHRETGISDSISVHNFSEAMEKRWDLSWDLTEKYKNNLAEQCYRFGRIIDDGFFGSCFHMLRANIFNF